METSFEKKKTLLELHENDMKCYCEKSKDKITFHISDMFIFN